MPDEPLDPTEALRHIRTLVEAAKPQAEWTPLEATLNEITNLLDRALPKPRRVRPGKSDETEDERR